MGNPTDSPKPVFIPQKQEPGEWDLGNFYSNAFRVARNFKTLWIFGLLLGGGIGGSLNFNLPSGAGSPSFNLPPSASPMPGVQHNQVLGATTDAFSQSASSIFSNIPIYLFIIIAIEIFLLIALGVLIGYLRGAFSNASSIIGTQKALDNQKLTLAQISTLALPKVKPNVRLMLLSALIFIPILLVVATSAFLIIINKAFLLLIPVIVFLVICLMIFWSVAITFTSRAITLEANNSAGEALKTGIKMARKKLFWSILTGIVNNLISSFVLFLPLLAFNLTLGLLGLLIGLLFQKALLTGAIFLGISLLLTFTVLAPILGSAIAIGKTSVWNQAYQKTKEILNG